MHAPISFPPPLAAVTAAFPAGTVYMAGGYVRDALLGRHSSDIDCAVTLPPAEIGRHLRAAGAVFTEERGGHGAFSLRCGAYDIQLTATRRDIRCDGRRAVTRFTPSLAADACRRDFTVNALYAGENGKIYDFTGAETDLSAKRLRFIGDPLVRCREDLLRVWRYYRFRATLPGGFRGETETARACARFSGRAAARLPAERIATETRRIYAGAFYAEALSELSAFADTKARDAAALPEGIDAKEIQAIASALRTGAAATEAEEDAILRIAALAAACGGEEAYLNNAASRLCLTKAEKTRLRALLQARAGIATHGAAALAEIYDLHGEEAAKQAAALYAAADNTDIRARALSLHEDIARMRLHYGAFPVKAADLAGTVAPGPDTGAALKTLRARWRSSLFTADKTALTDSIKSRL